MAYASQVFLENDLDLLTICYNKNSLTMKSIPGKPNRLINRIEERDHKGGAQCN